MARMKDKAIMLTDRYKNIDNIIDVINEVDTCLWTIEQSIARFELLIEHTPQKSILLDSLIDSDYIDIIKLLQKISNNITDYYEE